MILEKNKENVLKLNAMKDEIQDKNLHLEELEAKISLLEHECGRYINILAPHHINKSIMTDGNLRLSVQQSNVYIKSDNEACQDQGDT